MTQETQTYPTTIIVEELPNLPIGSLVIITNEEHPWFNDIAIIRNQKFKHYRIEVHGQLVWVPKDWVKQNEPNDVD